MIPDLPLTGTQRSRLERVYRKAEYQVPLHNRSLLFRVGEFDPAAEALLRMNTTIKSVWAILTPCNPRSQEATEEFNNYYYHEMRDALASHAGAWIRAVNHDPSGSWPDEPGFLVADPDLVWIRDLAAHFRQNAFVQARLGEAPKLIWLA